MSRPLLSLAALLVPIGFALGLSLAVPAVARAEDVQAEAPIDPVAVGRLLLSADAAERARGVSLLTSRVRQGGAGLASFLEAMAKAQASWADDEERLIPRWIDLVRTGSVEEQDRARRLLAASGREAVRRLLVTLRGAAQAGAVVPDPVPTTTPQAPAAEADPAAVAKVAPRRLDWPVATKVLTVPKAEIDRWVAAREDDLARLVTGHAVIVADAPEGELATAVARLPDARTLDVRHGKSAVRVATTVLLEGTRFRYRRDLARTGKGAWAVTTDTLPRGLEVELRIDEADDGRLRFEVVARNYEVPTPLPSMRIRPAPDVEEMEIDVPEWRVASMRTHVEVARDAPAASLLAFFPELVEGQVVVVSIRVMGLSPAAAARAANDASK